MPVSNHASVRIDIREGSSDFGATQLAAKVPLIMSEAGNLFENVRVRHFAFSFWGQRNIAQTAVAA